MALFSHIILCRNGILVVIL